jgi:predicted porin
MKTDNFGSPTAVSHFYPELATYGFSLQRSMLGGVVSTEYGYYHSLDDRSGKDAGIENSQSRFLVGYQKAFPDDLTLGIQYYAELMHQYRRYEDSLPAAFAKKEQLHQYFTLRLTRLFKYQTLKLSLFTFYSPDEADFLIIPEVSYKFSDNLKGVLGANIFGGAEDNTGLGQHAKNDNIYLTVRYSF